MLTHGVLFYILHCIAYIYSESPVAFIDKKRTQLMHMKWSCFEVGLLNAYFKGVTVSYDYITLRTCWINILHNKYITSMKYRSLCDVFKLIFPYTYV